ncbi:MAG: methyltransferase [Desulfobacula sp.]|uniref:methyltransferase n=1 Tax=Desulfobacula sp. TaxID=2593537 RepID=UPI0025BBEACC|nr:methyltransferase [Desulfobacula sp.]MCD4721971.1 methyltransferase [Desulfobacula sp.]
MNHSASTSRLFDFQDQADFRHLRDLLTRTGYMDSSVLDTIGINDLQAIKGNDHPLLLERTSTGSPLHILIRLFLMEMPVERSLLEKAIKPMTVTSWEQAGLVHYRANEVVAAVKLLPFQNLIVAFDLSSIMQTPLRENYVMGIGSSTITLSNLTIRRQSRRTLDLGAGCGVHAFLAAPHSDHTVAVDINPRAVQLAQFNAKLNAVSNIECLQGSFFEPVTDQKFDLVISNPPFVISPETRFIYRDGGMEADSVTRKIVQDVPRFLHEGGFCQILCNWVETSGKDWQKRLENWFEGTGCDAWVMRSESLTAATYASTWIKHTELFDQETQFAERFRKWMAYYEKLGIESIGAGLITMRKSEGKANWFRADESPEKLISPCWESIALGFELWDFLQTVRNDNDLLNSRLHYSPDIRLEQHFKPGEQGWKATASFISLSKGFVYKGNSDPLIANLLIKCDGQKPVKDLISDMIASLEADPEQITPTLCQLIRKLIEQGFLLPSRQA